MNVPNLYRKIKQILGDSNAALENKGLNSVDSISRIIDEIKKISINRFPYFMKKEMVEVREEDLDGVASIGYSMFSSFENLKSIVIPNSVTTMGSNTFYGCSSLESVILSDNLIDIGGYTFYNCKSLKTITIPNSVTTIGNYAFYLNYQLKDIYLKPITPPSLGNNYSIPNTTTIHVPIGSGDAYKAATNWSYHSARIVEDIEI